MRAEFTRAAGPQVVRQDTAGREAAATVVLVVGPLIELFLEIKMARDVTVSKGRSVFTGLGTAIATYLQTAGKGKIRKSTRPNGEIPKTILVQTVFATSFGGWRCRGF